MSDDDNGEPQPEYSIDAEVGDISLSVSGPSEQIVNEMFEDKFQRLVEESHDPDHHHVEAGAGWLIANASAETPEEAMAIWLDMWDRILDDVSELASEERRQMGLSQ